MGNVCSDFDHHNCDRGPVLSSARKYGVKDLRKIYQIDKTKMLGKGTFGTVYLSNNKNLPDFKVALKVLDK